MSNEPIRKDSKNKLEKWVKDIWQPDTQRFWHVNKMKLTKYENTPWRK